jgi:flagellar biosynthesis protein FlhF
MRDLIAETIDVRAGFPSLGRSWRIALVGATSCGKTTAAAKLASAYTSMGMRVGIVSIIAAEPGVSIAQDPRFAQLGIDVRYAASAEQAAQSAEAYAAHDLVIVDTPGTTYLDDRVRIQVDECLSAIGIDDVHVVVPLTTSRREALSLVDAFRPLGANRFIVSKIDESRHIGQLLNFGFQLGMPMTYLSDGPRVPNDLQAASSRAIAELILPVIDASGS